MESKLRLNLHLTSAIALLSCSISTAVATNTNPYTPLGIKVGSFILSPQLNIVNEFESNIYKTESDEKSDHILSINPSLNLSSNWNRHAIDFSVRTDLQYYSDQSSENQQNYNIDLAGRLDVLRDSYATAKLYHSMGTEDRGTVEGSGQDEPVEFFTTGGFLGYEHKFNRLRVNVSNDIKFIDYDSDDKTSIDLITGLPYNNNDRDRYQNTSELRFGYIINPNFEAFVRGSYTFIEYDKRFDTNGIERSSTGWDSTAGFRMDFTGKLTGEAHLGYMSRDTDDPTLGSINGLSGGMNLKWFATGLTTVSASLDRSIEETTQVNSSGYIATKTGIAVDHELLRNVLLNAKFGYTNKNYDGGGNEAGVNSREEDLYTYNVSAKYLFTRNFFVIGGYEFQDKDTNVSNNDYTNHKVMLTIGAQM